MLDWDPLQMNSTDVTQITPQCSFRMKSDIKNLIDEPPEGILMEPDEQDFLKVHVLITGAPGTPYEKGFFYFFIGFPSNYPFHPPKVRFMTTSGGKVRFNPNLYSNGKVCLSLLGLCCQSPVSYLVVSGSFFEL
ncbi:ubiquitin-conjugating enzyme E2 Z-like [Frankliniella occidentalis]|uniref:Ubiquitin-conjugating enzyme E2 Z n=1 Tax=Frankliniella occidentalis TaxID=133901 RepID=A0A9C6X9S2_FRAOC|nr:ubiquitin-conjugating enzyme E2 Z-like [Frankliniella occidentalis]